MHWNLPRLKTPHPQNTNWNLSLQASLPSLSVGIAAASGAAQQSCRPGRSGTAPDWRSSPHCPFCRTWSADCWQRRLPPPPECPAGWTPGRERTEWAPVNITVVCRESTNTKSDWPLVSVTVNVTVTSVMSRQSTTTTTDWPLVSVIVMSRESTSTKTDWPPVNITAAFRESTTTNTDWPLVNTTVTSRESTTTKTKWPLVNVIATSRERPPVSVTVMSGESTTTRKA